MSESAKNYYTEEEVHALSQPKASPEKDHYTEEEVHALTSGVKQAPDVRKILARIKPDDIKAGLPIAAIASPLLELAMGAGPSVVEQATAQTIPRVASQAGSTGGLIAAPAAEVAAPATEAAAEASGHGIGQSAKHAAEHLAEHLVPGLKTLKKYGPAAVAGSALMHFIQKAVE